MILTGEMLTFEDYFNIIVLLFFLAAIATLVLEIVAFIPSFMISLVRSVRNKSLQEQTDILETKLTPSLNPESILITKLEPKLESTINPGQNLRKR